MTFWRLVVLTLRLALPLYLLSLILGLLGTIVALPGLWSFADRPWLGDLVGPNWLNVLVEVGVSAMVAPPADRQALGLLGLEALLVTPLLVMLQWIGYTFLAGGILERLLADQLARAASHGFWPDCRRWFWPFVLLGAVGTVLFAFLAALGGAMAVLGARVVGINVSAVLLAVWIALLFGWLELARAAMVWRGRRSVGKALELASRRVIRPRSIALWILLAVPSLGLLVLTASAPRTGQTSWTLTTLMSVGLGQAVAFLAAWLKVIRLAAASRLVASPTRPEASIVAG